MRSLPVRASPHAFVNAPVPPHMAKLDHKRVDLFYEKLTGEKPDRRGGWKIEQRNIAQKPRSFEAAAEADAIIESS